MQQLFETLLPKGKTLFLKEIYVVISRKRKIVESSNLVKLVFRSVKIFDVKPSKETFNVNVLARARPILWFECVLNEKTIFNNNSILPHYFEFDWWQSLFKLHLLQLKNKFKVVSILLNGHCWRFQRNSITFARRNKTILKLLNGSGDYDYGVGVQN